MQTGRFGDEARFLRGGGEMGDLLRCRDWSATALGHPADWPPGLRTSIRLMLNAGHPISIFWGPESHCFYNDAFAVSLGPEQHPSSLGRPGHEVWQGSSWEAISPQIEQVLAGRGSTWHENQLLPITRNGVREDAYWTYSFGPIDEESAPNGIGGVLVICTETTRQVRLTKRLATTDERLNQALSAGRGIGTWDWDVVNDQVVADARFARLYGADPERARIGAPLVEFFTAIHPDDLPGLKEKIAAALHAPSDFSAEYRLVRPDGRIVWVLAEGRTEFDEQGRAVRLSGVSMDITERRLIEARLRSSEAHYRSVVAALHEGIFVTDAGGRLISCNPAAERIIGASWSEWEGGTAIAPGWQPLRADGTPMPAEELPVGRVLAGCGPQIDIELDALDRHGKPAVFEISAVPVTNDDTGALMAVVTLFVDVTARRRADEELRSYRKGLEAIVSQRTADLEAVNEALHKANHALALSRDEAELATRAKSAFLANMSHEIRTPMNAIIGYTYLIAQDAKDKLQQENVAKVSNAAQHLLGIVDDILDLSAIEAGRLVLMEQDFDLDEVIAGSMSMVRTKASEKQLSLTSSDASRSHRLRGDATRLTQMLVNLLANAVKFTQQGSIELTVAQTAAQSGRLKFRFEVKDTGPGIAPERQGALFKAFEQADNSSSRRHGGTGLGLALTRQLATAMGGEAGLMSDLGKGSTFWFTAWLVPAAPRSTSAPATGADSGAVIAASVAPSVAATVAAGGGDTGVIAERRVRQMHASRRVLLAEDNPINRMMAESLLRRVGLVVESASDGMQAVEMALSRTYDLVLMDLQMPVMDGLDAAAAILGRHPNAPPIVAMTANAFATDREASIRAGMIDHVAKPIIPALLYEKLLRWLGTEKNPPRTPAA